MQQVSWTKMRKQDSRKVKCLTHLIDLMTIITTTQKPSSRGRFEGLSSIQGLPTRIRDDVT